MFRALEIETGKVRWSYDISQDGDQQSFHGRMWVDDELVIIGTDTPTGHIYAFEKETGAVRWKRPEGKGVSTEVLGVGDRTFVLTTEDTLLCLNRLTGDVIWSFFTEAAGGDLSNDLSPALMKNLIFVAGLDKILYALNTEDGEIIWSNQFQNPFSSHLLVNTDGLIVGTEDEFLYQMDPSTGVITAKLALGGKPVGTIASTEESLLLVLSGHNATKLISVDRKLKHIEWEKPAPQSKYVPMLPYVWNDKVLIGGSEKGTLNALQIKDGKQLWSLNLSGYIKVAGRNGNLFYVGNQDGTLYVYQALR